MAIVTVTAITLTLHKQHTSHGTLIVHSVPLAAAPDARFSRDELARVRQQSHAREFRCSTMRNVTTFERRVATRSSSNISATIVNIIQHAVHCGPCRYNRLPF